MGPLNGADVDPLLRDALQRLGEAGGPSDGLEPSLGALDAAVDQLAHLWAPRVRDERIAAAWAAVESARAQVAARGPGALPELRVAVDAYREAIGQRPRPPHVLPPAHLCAFADARPARHLATDIDTLDRFTLGGLWCERLIVVAGEPNVGKTAFAMQLAGTACEGGCAVAVHASDVDKRADIAARIGVARGISRGALRRCEPDAQAATAAIMRDWSFKIADQFADDFLIEDTLETLLEMTRPKQRAVLIVDSLQTALCRALVGPGAPRFPKERVEATTDALIRATRRGVLVIATSEVPRGFYSGKVMDQPSDMAAVKGSGRVEFALWTLLVLRRQRDAEPNTFHLGMPKNKGGQPEGALRLLYRPELGTFTDGGEVSYLSKAASAEDRKPQGEEDQGAYRARIDRLGHALLPHLLRELVAAGPAGLSLRELRRALTGKDAAKDRAVRLALDEHVIVRRQVRGYDRYYSASVAPPLPTSDDAQ